MPECVGFDWSGGVCMFSAPNIPMMVALHLWLKEAREYHSTTTITGCGVVEVPLVHHHHYHHQSSRGSQSKVCNPSVKTTLHNRTLAQAKQKNMMHSSLPLYSTLCLPYYRTIYWYLEMCKQTRPAESSVRRYGANCVVAYASVRRKQERHTLKLVSVRT